MAYSHESDLVSHIGDHIDDLNIDGLWAETVGNMLATAREQKPISAEVMIGMGAGQAYPELDLARIAGIPSQNVFLLDRVFSTTARERIATVAPESKLIESGVFSFLQNPDGNRFTLVTTFGLHDVLKGKNVEEFFRLIPNCLDDSAVVFLQHLGFRFDPRKIAAKYGFRALSKSNDYLYFFEPS